MKAEAKKKIIIDYLNYIKENIIECDYHSGCGKCDELREKTMIVEVTIESQQPEQPREHCKCNFAMIMRNQDTQIAYCSECKKEIDESIDPKPDTSQVEADTKKCKECGGRTALIHGSFYYEPDSEPYMSGIEEDAKVSTGECWVGAYKCDDCDNIQGLWTE